MSRFFLGIKRRLEVLKAFVEGAAHVVDCAAHLLQRGLRARNLDRQRLLEVPEVELDSLPRGLFLREASMQLLDAVFQLSDTFLVLARRDWGRHMCLLRGGRERAVCGLGWRRAVAFVFFELLQSASACALSSDAVFYREQAVLQLEKLVEHVLRGRGRCRACSL